MAVDTLVSGALTRFRAAEASPAFNSAAVDIGREAVHTQIDRMFQSGVTAGDIRDTMQMLQTEGFDLTKNENRYLFMSELVGGVHSSWARRDIQNRIDINYGEGWQGRMKAWFAGANQERMRSGEQETWYQELNRRAAKVLGKSAISAGIGGVTAGAAAMLLGGPVAWGALGAAVGGAAIGRSAVEAYRGISGKERLERNRLNTNYIEMYQKAGRLAHDVLTLERQRITAASPDDRNRYEDQIRTKYSELIGAIDGGELQSKEKELREKEIKAEKASNWGAVIGGVAGSAAYVLHGVSQVRGEGMQLDFKDADKITHNVRYNSSDHHFYYYDPKDTLNMQIDPTTGNPVFGIETTHHVPGQQVFDWQGGHQLKEGWSEVMRALYGQALQGGLVVAPELAGAMGAEASAEKAGAVIDARRAEVEKYDKNKAFLQARELGTPEEPPPSNPDFAVGVQYVFEPEPGKTLELNLIGGGSYLILAGNAQVWRIKSFDRDNYKLEQVYPPAATGTPNPTIEINKTEFGKGKKWEHAAYNPEQWKRVERWSSVADYLTSKVGTGEIIVFNKNGKSALGLAPSAENKVQSVDKEKDSIIFVDKSGAETEKKLSDAVSRIELPKEEATADTPEKAGDELAKLSRRFELAFGKEMSGMQAITIKRKIKYSSDGESFIFLPNEDYIVDSWDEEKREFKVKMVGGSIKYIGAERLLKDTDEIEWRINTIIANKPPGDSRPGPVVGGLYQLATGQRWEDAGVIYQIVPPRGRGVSPPPENMVLVQECPSVTSGPTGPVKVMRKIDIANMVFVP